jgi:hypothetical protein
VTGIVRLLFGVVGLRVFVQEVERLLAAVHPGNGYYGRAIRDGRVLWMREL